MTRPSPQLRPLALLLALLASLTATGTASRAAADNGVGDGLYGRLRHDFFLQLAVGGGVRLFPSVDPAFEIDPDPSRAEIAGCGSRFGRKTNGLAPMAEATPTPVVSTPKPATTAVTTPASR